MIYRNPVPGRPLPSPLPCLGPDCQRKRGAIDLGNLNWKCPNHAKDHPGGCETRSFTYVRGKREDGSIHYHQGIDVGDKIGQEIVSVVNGKVVWHVDKWTQGFSGYGKCVVVHGEDGLFYLYAHCSKLLVQADEMVTEQQPIAEVGTTCYEKEDKTKEFEGGKRAHLHFEVSKTNWGHGAKGERSIEGANSDGREDPLEVLERLGPYGVSKKFFLPSGEQLSRQNAEQTMIAIDHQDGGGYFPLGGNNFWHSGVHLFLSAGARLHAPFGGTIVAMRLDEKPEFGYREFGSSNFLLLKHQVPAAIAKKFEAPAPTNSSSNSTSGGTQPAQDKPTSDNGAASKPPPKPSVGVKQNKPPKRNQPGTNAPADVRKGTQMLRKAVDAQGQPFYDRAADPVSGEDQALVDAILAFQRHIIAKRGLRWQPDGIMVVNGTTWRALEEETGGAEEPTPDEESKQDSSDTSDATKKEGAQDDSAQPEKKEEKKEEKKDDDSKTIYSLFMHLEVVPLDEKRLQIAPWLDRLKTQATRDREQEERDKAEADYKKAKEEYDKKEAADRAEGGEHSLQATVGVKTERRNQIIMANQPADVMWVKKRLTRHGYYSGPIDDDGVNPDFLVALGNFQVKHTKDSASNPPRYIVPKRRTEKALSMTHGELKLDKPPTNGATQRKLTLDPEVLAKLRERDDLDVAKVVTDHPVEVQVGEVLWTTGYGSAMAGEEPAALVHWSIFSEEALMARWEKLEDDNDDLSVDACDKLIAYAEQQGGSRDGGDGVLTKDEVAAFYNSGAADFLRFTQAYFRSEWGADLDKVAAKLEELQIDVVGDARVALHPYTFWQEAKAVLPQKPHVWHYHPVAFLKEYAEAAGALTGDLVVETYIDKARANDIEVILTRDGKQVRATELSKNGMVRFVALDPGNYDVEAQKDGETLDAEHAVVRLNAQTRVELGDPPERSAATTAGDNPFLQPDGRPYQLTRLREGAGPKTLKCYAPPSANSGVTLGYGYDFGARSAASVRADFSRAGIEAEKAESVVGCTGLRGPAAASWLTKNKASVDWTLTEPQRAGLLQVLWPEYESKSRRQATVPNEKTSNTVISEQRYDSLDEHTKELLTDMGYVGAPLVYNQDKINRILADESLDTAGRLRKLREVVSGLADKQQRADGRKKRIQWIDAKLVTLGEEP